MRAEALLGYRAVSIEDIRISNMRWEFVSSISTRERIFAWQQRKGVDSHMTILIV